MLDSTSSLAPVAVTTAPAEVRVNSASRTAASLRGAPLWLSLLGHAALAFAAARYDRLPRVEVAPKTAIEVAAPELAVESEVAPSQPAQNAAAPSGAATPGPALASSPAAAPIEHFAAASSVRAASVLQPVTAVASALGDAAESAALVAPTPAAAPHFSMTVPASSRPTSSVVNAVGNGAFGGSTSRASTSSGVQAPISERAADFPAKLVAGTPPAYTAAAQVAGIEADVPLEIVVNRAGGVESARALAHVGYGLDEAALAAVRGYHFSPAYRAGDAVAVRMRWTMRFQLR